MTLLVAWLPLAGCQLQPGDYERTLESNSSDCGDFVPEFSNSTLFYDADGGLLEDTVDLWEFGEDSAVGNFPYDWDGVSWYGWFSANVGDSFEMLREIHPTGARAYHWRITETWRIADCSQAFEGTARLTDG